MSMPGNRFKRFDFRSVIIFLTFVCPVGCSTCNTQANPGATGHLGPDWLSRFLVRLKALKTTEYLIWTGGEPFEAFDSLAAGIRVAAKLGFRSEILTSGCWYTEFPGRLAELAESGIFRIRISLDAEHQSAVDIETVHSLVDDILARGIPLGFTLRRIPGSLRGPGDYVAELLKRHPELRSAQERSSRLFHVLPTIPADFPPDQGASGVATDPGPCRLGFRDLVIGPDGRVYPCCGLFGIGIDDRVSTGDAMTDFPEPASKSLAERPLFRDLREKGAYSMARDRGLIPGMIPASGYAGPCHACRMILPVLTEPATEMDSDSIWAGRISGGRRS